MMFKLSKLSKHLISINPDIIFHLAAQSLVKKSYMEPKINFNTNIIGTANLLNASRNVRKQNQ